MAQFYTNESVSLDKVIENRVVPRKIGTDHLNDVYEIDKCVQWVKDNSFVKVCLQFPDFMLPDSCDVATSLQDRLGHPVYIMGDTSYESCCVDYVAAAHVNADCIIHYGPKCLSQSSGDVPCLKINEKHVMALETFRNAFAKQFLEVDQVEIVLDLPYIHHIEQIKTELKDFPNVTIKSIADVQNTANNILYVGQNDRKLMIYEQIHVLKNLHYYNPTTDVNIEKYCLDSRLLKRRYFLIEKIKDSKTVGIVIATLAIRNYLNVLDRVKTLLKLYNKKYYVISVGKPTVAKLANFPEIDIYVVICCSMNEIFENRDFYQPLATPYDVETALNPNANELKFSYDFNSSLNLNAELNESIILGSSKNDVSLLTGRIRSFEAKNVTAVDEMDGTIAVKSDGTLTISSEHGAGYLSDRTWKGLEQNLGKTEVSLATDGRKGIAQGYVDEGS